MPKYLLSDAVLELSLDERLQPPVWVIGSGMTVANGNEVATRGVPGTRELAMRLIAALQDFDVPEERHLIASLRTEASAESPNWPQIYQMACDLFMPNRPVKLRHLIREAVLEATSEPLETKRAVPPDRVDILDAGVSGHGLNPAPGYVLPGRTSTWVLRPGLEELARIVRDLPCIVGGHAIITTNFDPLISVALANARVSHVRTAIDDDFPLAKIASSVPVVHHVHGYWTSSALLNLRGELDASRRSTLSQSLTDLMRQRTVFVLGYGGWDDVVMDGIKNALTSPDTHIVWFARSSGTEFVDFEGRIRTTLCGQNPKPGRLSFVEDVDGDDALAALGARVPTRSSGTINEDSIQLLKRRIVELESIISRRNELKEALRAISEAVAAHRQESTAANAKIKEASDLFAKTTLQFSSDFNSHRELQAERLTEIGTRTREIHSTLSRADKTVTMIASDVAKAADGTLMTTSVGHIKEELVKARQDLVEVSHSALWNLRLALAIMLVAGIAVYLILAHGFSWEPF